MRTKKDGWKAVKRGPIYCAPLCGGGCTWAAHDYAAKRANWLVARMNKLCIGWKPRVHENLGWHYSIELPLGGGDWLGELTLKLYEENFSERRYWTLLGTAGGDPRFTLRKNFNTPEAAVSAQIKVFRQHAKMVAKQAQELEAALEAATKR